jgi:hypothetical protein
VKEVDMRTRHGFVVATAAAVLATMAGCSNSATTTATTQTAAGTHAASSPPTTNPLIGTWQTAAVPEATWEATYRRAGATPDEITQFRVGLGKEDRIILRLSGTDWVQFEQNDDQAPEVGSDAKFTVSGDTVRLTGTDLAVPCHQVLRFAINGDTLRLRVVSNGADDVPPCSRDDQLHAPVLFETAPFERTG